MYIDLDNINWNSGSTPEDVQNALAGHEPIAVVRAQGTGKWDTKMTTAAALKEVKGEHTIYVVYNLPSSAGANIYGLYLDPDAGTGTGLKPTATIEGLNVYSVNSEIIVNATEPVSVVIYTISGMPVANKVLPAGNTTISNLPEGMYLLKATNQNGAVSISKLMVK